MENHKPLGYNNYNMDKKIQTHKKKNNKKILVVAILGWSILILSIAGVSLAANLNKVSIVVNENTNQSVVLVTNVCGTDIIDKYNTLLKSNSAEEYISGFKTLADEINLLPNHDEDVNCSYILYNYYLYNEDTAKAGEYVDRLKDQNSHGNYLSGDINEIDSIYWVEYKLKLFEENGIKLDMFDTNGAG